MQKIWEKSPQKSTNKKLLTQTPIIDVHIYYTSSIWYKEIARIRKRIIIQL